MSPGTDPEHRHASGPDGHHGDPAAPPLDVADVVQRNLLENAEEVVYFKDLESRFIRVSEGCARLHRRTPEEMIGLTDFDLFTAAHARRAFADERTIIRTGVPILHKTERERWLDRPDSWVSSSKFPLRSADGTIIGTFGISRDVTELVRAEQEMARLADGMEAANAELRRVEAQLRAVLDASTDAIAQYDRRLRYQYINPAVEQSRGTTLDRLIGRTDREIGMAETSLELWEGALRSVLETGEPGEMEFAVPAADGGETWFHTTLSPDLDDAGRVVGVLTSTRDITVTKRAEMALAHQARHDSVTGLANRYLLMERLAQAVERMSRRGRLVLCFVDVDHFKEVNDTYGHDVGDRVLQEIARRLLAVTRSSDTVARLGGDEFVVLREGVPDDADVRRLAESVVAVLAEPVRSGSSHLRVSASVGAVVSDDPRTTPSELLRDADAAMYRAKRGGRNQFRLSGEGEGDVLTSTTLEADLRTAMAEDQFRLVYQPLLSLANQRVLGFEALLRWDHPERGPLLPRDFVPFADRRGMMGTIGAWVLRKACAQLAEWTDGAANRGAGGADSADGAGGPDLLTIAVNVTARQLRTDGFVDLVTAVLNSYRLQPGQLRLEVPERALHEEGLELTEVLLDLTDLGVQLAVDDFGASVAALARLPRMPVSVVKLERFADLPDKGALISAVIEVAHGLGMSVVGGGIESTAQLRELHALACDDGQGFLLGRPLELPEVGRLLDADSASRRAQDYARRISGR
jgi:diguanylate cyclase (GGDEF)-like protein/PAS domain S-box-containing protein